MKRLLFFSISLVSVLICGTVLAADITGEYFNKDGVIVIKKSNDAKLIRVKYKNGHTAEFVTAIQSSAGWVEKTVLKKADDAYYVTIRSKKGDCDYEGLTVLKKGTYGKESYELLVDDDMNYPIFSVFLEHDGITANIPRVSGGDACLYMGQNTFKKK